MSEFIINFSSSSARSRAEANRESRPIIYLRPWSGSGNTSIELTESLVEMLALSADEPYVSIATHPVSGDMYIVKTEEGLKVTRIGNRVGKLAKISSRKVWENLRRAHSEDAENTDELCYICSASSQQYMGRPMFLLEVLASENPDQDQDQDQDPGTEQAHSPELESESESEPESESVQNNPFSF